MIASTKLRHPYLFAARIAPKPCTCVYLFCFLSKNENNNGFDTIGLNSASVDDKRVANIRFTVVFRIVLPGCLFLEWMRILHNEHHLAAKFGTCPVFLM
jgi:hypothetical protein